MRGHLTERQQQDLVADAFAAIRFYREFYASSERATKHIKEIVQALAQAGKTHDMGKYGCILTTCADAISRAYLNRSLEKLASEDREAA